MSVAVNDVTDIRIYRLRRIPKSPHDELVEDTACGFEFKLAQCAGEEHRPEFSATLT
jgi:hypothetical protein